MKFFIKDFFSRCDQIRSFLRIWSHLLKKSLMENFIFCAVFVQTLLKIAMKVFRNFQSKLWFMRYIFYVFNIFYYIKPYRNQTRVQVSFHATYSLRKMESTTCTAQKMKFSIKDFFNKCK